MIYLASPYSHPDKQVEQRRFEAVASKCAEFARASLHVYSPIVHWHPIARLHDMPTDYSFYRRINEDMIRRCDGVFVLTLDGWEQSLGIRHEIDFAEGLRISVALMGPDEPVIPIKEHTA